jgi:hypothetical protein
MKKSLSIFVFKMDQYTHFMQLHNKNTLLYHHITVRVKRTDFFIL